MFIKQMRICNFRNIEDINIDFHKGLNILVGENNAGKSAIMDALRICLGFGKQNRDLYIKRSDFHIDRNSIESPIKPIEFHLIFEMENPTESGVFIELFSQSQDGTQKSLQIHYKYYLEERNGMYRMNKIKSFGKEDFYSIQ